MKSTSSNIYQPLLDLDQEIHKLNTDAKEIATVNCKTKALNTKVRSFAGLFFSSVVAFPVTHYLLGPPSRFEPFENPQFFLARSVIDICCAGAIGLTCAYLPGILITFHDDPLVIKYKEIYPEDPFKPVDYGKILNTTECNYKNLYKIKFAQNTDLGQILPLDIWSVIIGYSIALNRA